jgi:hypothetical protein
MDRRILFVRMVLDFVGVPCRLSAERSDQIAEHQIVHTGGNDGESSTTSCFLESTEGSVSPSNGLYENLTVQIFTVIVRVQGAVRHHPAHDWRITVSADGRQIKRSARRRENPKDVRASTLISAENGNLVEGKLIFARLVNRNKETEFEADMQHTTDNDAEVTLEGMQLRSVGQISVSFERGTVGKSMGKPYRPEVVQSDVGIASERGKK